jgi:hypothetical protein
MTKPDKKPFFVFVFFLLSMISTWFLTKDLKSQWLNVPPVPDQNLVAFNALSDEQMSYRLYTIMLQNLGNTGGRIQSLKNYDYSQLERWWLTLDTLDWRSNSVPLLAAYYFGAVNDPVKLDHILNYLSIVGQRSYGEKWRWLGHAVYIARHMQKDNERALELAYLLAANESPDLGEWAKQMPAFILRDEGDTRAAYQIMMNLLISGAETMHPNEINFMVDYICNTILEEDPTIPKPEICT